MEKLNFFVPVTYHPTPNALFNKSISTVAKEWADEFFVWKDGPRAYVIDINNESQNVQLVTCQTSPWKTAVKVALLATPIFPLMLLIKLYARLSTSFNVVNPNLNANRSEFEPIFYQKHSFKQKEATDHRYEEICRKQGFSYENATVLQKHVVFFADENGNISQDSIQKSFERLHSSKIISYIIARTLFNGMAKTLKTTAPYFSIKDINKIIHSADTNVFTKGGQFDEKKFEELVTKYASANTMLLSADSLNKMMQANQLRDKDKPDIAHGTRATTGEFGMTLNLFSDCALVDRHGNTIKALTPDRLKSLYLDGPHLFEEVAAL